MSGAEGTGWLERYEESGDPADLDRAIERYEGAIAEHPREAYQWWYWLALTLQERAAVTGNLADLDRTIQLCELVADEFPRGDEARDTVLTTLAEAHRDRFRIAYHRDGAPFSAGRTAADAIAATALQIGDEAVLTTVRALQGLTLAEISDVTGEPSDLEATIAVLAPAVAGLAPGLPLCDEACGELCLAYRERARNTGDEHDLELAIEAGRRAGESAEPDLNYALGLAHQDRWNAGADLSDLDAAIEYWRRALAVSPVPAVLADCAALFLERAEARSDPADVGDAIELLERALEAGDPCSWYLGTAYQLRWTMGRDLADLERAVEWFDRGLAEIADPSWLAAAHLDRLVASRVLTETQTAADPGRIPPAATRLQAHLDASAELYASGAGESDERARLAAEMALSAMLIWQTHPDLVDSSWLREMAGAARLLRDQPPEWSAALDLLMSLSYAVDEAMGATSAPQGAVEALVATLKNAQDLKELPEVAQEIAPLFVSTRAVRTGAQGLLRSAVAQLGASPDLALSLWAEAFDLSNRIQHGDLAAREELRNLLGRVRELPLTAVDRQGLLPFVSVLASTISGADGVYQPVDRTPIPPGDRHAADLALRGLGGPALAAVTRHDVATLRECADRLDELLGFFPADHVLRLIATNLACVTGTALLHDEPGDQEICHRLLRWSGEGIAVVGGPHHPRWPVLAMARADALRHLHGGDRAESRRWGLAALHGFVWRVLLQSGTDDAVLVAAGAGEVAHRVAGWCLADDAPGDLIATLDTGRGLVLQAATASRTIADRLAEAGHHDLAERWRASAGYGGDAITGQALQAGTSFEIPDELRNQVLHVLGPAAAAPASIGDIRAALVRAGADALVYLVPSGAEQPGAAVLVRPTGEPVTLILPGLITTPGSVFDIGAAQVRGRDAGPVPSGGEPDELYRWAWRASMGAVLGQASAWGLGRPARLVLVPTGELSGVPWHAAVRVDGDRLRYAVEDAVISYASSGPAFAQSASESPGEVKSVLIVGDPTGELPFAGMEARAIGQAFYPDGTALGSADGTGTPRQVLDWIAAAAPGPSMLHLACHGYADPLHPADACLKLAGGDLTARSLLEASRTAELEIEQVFLAACATGAGGADHDEAFSLATAFLAAGARTVVGSLWTVPDEATSLLMFLVHHFLVTDRCAPVDALRQAQLWMLDPQRRAPAGMPAELAGHAADPQVADPRSWAAFVHRGR